jgi:hypothetical protein
MLFCCEKKITASGIRIEIHEIPSYMNKIILILNIAYNTIYPYTVWNDFDVDGSTGNVIRVYSGSCSRFSDIS